MILKKTSGGFMRRLLPILFAAVCFFTFSPKTSTAVMNERWYFYAISNDLMTASDLASYNLLITNYARYNVSPDGTAGWQVTGYLNDAIPDNSTQVVSFLQITNFYKPLSFLNVCSNNNTQYTNNYARYSNSLTVVVENQPSPSAPTWYATSSADFLSYCSSYKTAYTNNQTISPVPTGQYVIVFNSAVGYPHTPASISTNLDATRVVSVTGTWPILKVQLMPVAAQAKTWSIYDNTALISHANLVHNQSTNLPDSDNYTISFEAFRGYNYPTNITLTPPLGYRIITNTYLPYSNSLAVTVAGITSGSNSVWTLAGPAELTNSISYGTKFTNTFTLTAIPTGLYTVTFPAIIGFTAPTNASTNITGASPLINCLTGTYASVIWGTNASTNTPATNFPAYTNAITLMVTTNGLFKTPSREKIIAANGLNASGAWDVAGSAGTVATNLTTHTTNTAIHVSTGDRTNWDGKTTLADVNAAGYATNSTLDHTALTNANGAVNVQHLTAAEKSIATNPPTTNGFVTAAVTNGVNSVITNAVYLQSLTNAYFETTRVTTNSEAYSNAMSAVQSSAIVGVSNDFQAMGASISNYVIAADAGISNAFEAAALGVSNAFLLNDASISNDFQLADAGISNDFQAMGGSISNYVIVADAGISNDFQAMGASISNYVIVADAGISNAFEVAALGVSNAFLANDAGISNAFAAMGASITQGFQGMGASITQGFQGMGASISNYVVAADAGISNDFQLADAGISNDFQLADAGISNVFNATTNYLSKNAFQCWTAIKNSDETGQISVAYSDGSLVLVVPTVDNSVLTFDPSDNAFPTGGVCRVNVCVAATTNALGYRSNRIRNDSTFNTSATNGIASLFFRLHGTNFFWIGRQ